VPGISRRALLTGAAGALGASVVRSLLAPGVGTTRGHYALIIDGLVEQPLDLTFEDLLRFPSVSRTYFLACAKGYRAEALEESTPEDICGRTRNSEWTGVLLSTLFREAGVRPGAAWFRAVGRDAAAARAIPIDKGWDDAMVAYRQDGQALSPEHGYPARLLCPGWAGYASVKWLRRIELSDRPLPSPAGEARGCVGSVGRCATESAREPGVVINARSIITSPSYPLTLRPGRVEVLGYAWSGRGRIARADVSFDDGRSWRAAELQPPVLPKAYTQFRYIWHWDGRVRTVLSRAVDETGYVQPTRRELAEARAGHAGSPHVSPITGWRIRSDGSVVYRTEIQA
jgi:sulfane dehydrogenase subunit SoxC